MATKKQNKMIWKLIYRKAQAQQRTVQSILNELDTVISDLLECKKSYNVWQKQSGAIKGNRNASIHFLCLQSKEIQEIVAYLSD